MCLSFLASPKNRTLLEQKIEPFLKIYFYSLLADENRTQHTSSSGGLSNSTQNTTTTSLHSSAGTTQATQPATAFGAGGGGGGSTTQLRRPAVIDQQPLPLKSGNNNSDSVYVNTEYSNRETMLCDGNLDQQDLLSAAQQQPPPSPATALYLNHSALIQAQAAAAAVEQQQQQQQQARLAVSANGVVRKLPEHLVLTQQTLAEAVAQQNSSNSVQASPALSTASGPYIPISECFSGSPRYLPGTGPGAGAGAGEVAIPNNPTTPLNNLDPKFYDTPRSHNNIGLNLTNDQSYSPKITNLSLVRIAFLSNKRVLGYNLLMFYFSNNWPMPMLVSSARTRIRRAFSRMTTSGHIPCLSARTWVSFQECPMLVELVITPGHTDRSTRPSDSSIENESFVLTYSQRFSKMPEEGGWAAPLAEKLNSKLAAGAAATASDPAGDQRTLEKLAKVLKNKNNLILDFKENEK